MRCNFNDFHVLTSSQDSTDSQIGFMAGGESMMSSNCASLDTISRLSAWPQGCIFYIEFETDQTLVKETDPSLY